MKPLSLSVIKRKLVEERAGGIIPQAEDVAGELMKERGIKVGDSKRLDPKPPTPKQGNFGNTKAKITKYTPVKAGSGEKSTGGFSPEKNLEGGNGVVGKAQKGKEYGNRPKFSKASSPGMKVGTSGNSKSPMPDAKDLKGNRGFMGKDHISPQPVFYKGGAPEDSDTRGSNNTKKPTWDGKGMTTFKPGKGEPKISGIEGGNSVLKTGGIWKNIDQSPREEHVEWPNMKVGSVPSPGGSKNKSPNVKGDGRGGQGGSGKDKSPAGAWGDHGKERGKPKAFGESTRSLLREFFEDQIASELLQKVNDGVVNEGDVQDLAMDKAREMSQDPGAQRQIYENIMAKFNEMHGGPTDEETDEDNLAASGETELHDTPNDNEPPEPVMDGVIELRVGGRRKLFLEAVTPTVLTRIIDGYEQAGVRVQIRQASSSKPSYGDAKFVRRMMEAVHAKKHGMSDLESQRLRSAFRTFKGLLESEYSPFYYESKADWSERAVLPAFHKAVMVFEETYNERLRPYDLIVRAKTRDGLEDFDVMTEAFSREMAVSNAITEVRSTAGLDVKIIHAFVDGRKYIGEELSNSPFAKLPAFFSDMPSPPGKLVQGKREGGDVAKKPKVDKWSYTGTGKAKYDGYGGMKTVDSMKVVGKSGKVTDPNMKDPKPPKEKEVSDKDLKVKDDGPIYCESNLGAKGRTSRASAAGYLRGQSATMSSSSSGQAMNPAVAKLVLALRQDAASCNDHGLGVLLSRLSDKLEYGTKLDGDEASALNKYLSWKQGKSAAPQLRQEKPMRSAPGPKPKQRMESRWSNILGEDGSVVARIERDAAGNVIGIGQA